MTGSATTMTDITSDNLDQAIEEGGQTIIRAIARRLARDGAKVALWDVMDDDAKLVGLNVEHEHLLMRATRRLDI
jgi:hypothetical protein